MPLDSLWTMKKRVWLSPVSKNDIVRGTWSANGNTGDLLISYGDRRVEGFYSYQSLTGGKARALIVEDVNNNGIYDVGDVVFGGFSAKASFVARIPPVVSGRFTADPDTGRFNLFYGSTRYASGSVFDPAEYF